MATADIRLSFGALLIGVLISVGFSGIGTLQAYFYFRKYRRRDSQVIKSTVLAAWLLDLTHTIFISQGLWHYLVLNWGNVTELDHLTWTVGASIAVTGSITFLTQMFFANRVWRLSKHNAILTIVIVAFSVVRFASALTTTTMMIRLGHFSTFIQQFRWLFTFGLALSCLIDLVITTSLCYYLQGNRTGYSSVDDVIHRLLLYTINNGLLTTFASFLAMLFAATLPHNFLFLSTHFVIAKCYINSLLATLNSRDLLRERDESHAMAIHFSRENTNAPSIFKNISDRRVTPSPNRPSGVPATTITSLGGIGQTTTVDSVKVHINVEQTIHRDDGDTEADLSPSESFKGRYLDSVTEKEASSP